jgi:transcriptional regulator GlxA family with amidase domain
MSPDADLEQIEEALTLAFGALRGQFVSAGVQQCLSPSVRHVLERIQDDISDPASLDTLAEGAGLSRFQTLRLFAKEVGATPHAYLTQLRINAVKRMIVAGTPLAEASVACGFADQSHMTRAFQRQYGITPGKYRRRSQI